MSTTDLEIKLRIQKPSLGLISEVLIHLGTYFVKLRIRKLIFELKCEVYPVVPSWYRYLIFVKIADPEISFKL
jgi:hypothetical protein